MRVTLTTSDLDWESCAILPTKTKTINITRLQMIPTTKLAKAILFCNILYGVFLAAILIFAWLAAHDASQRVPFGWIYPVAPLLWAWASLLAYQSINKLRRALAKN
jgi:hypothetical protein